MVGDVTPCVNARACNIFTFTVKICIPSPTVCPTFSLFYLSPLFCENDHAR